MSTDTPVLEPKREPWWRTADRARRAGAILLSARPTSAVEVAAAGVLLAAIALAVYGPHLTHGGFVEDDWSLSAGYHYPWAFAKDLGTGPGRGFGAAVHAYMLHLSFRPVGAMYLLLTHAVLGFHQHYHLAAALALGILVSVALYLVLRMLGLEVVHAFAISALVLLFPAADTSKLWATGSQVSLAIALYLAGLAVALRGLRAAARSAVALHAVAVAIYLASILVYELTAPAVICAALLYRTRTGWRPALARWAVDAAATAVIVITVTSQTPHAPNSVHSWISRAGTLASQGLTVLAETVLPSGKNARLVPVLAVLLVLALAALAGLLLRPGAPGRTEFRRWAAFGAAGLVAAAVGYAMLIPSGSYYSPIAAGWVNRINSLAALGFITAVYAAVCAAATFVSRRTAHVRGVAASLAVATAAAISVAYGIDVRSHIRVWDAHYREELKVLAAPQAAVPNLPKDATVYLLNVPQVVNGVPVFAAAANLNAAYKVDHRNPDGSAYSLYPRDPFTAQPIRMVCARKLVYPTIVGNPLPGWLSYDRNNGAPYGKAFFVDLRSGRSAVVDSRSSCETLTQFIFPPS